MNQVPPCTGSHCEGRWQQPVGPGTCCTGLRGASFLRRNSRSKQWGEMSPALSSRLELLGYGGASTLLKRAVRAGSLSECRLASIQGNFCRVRVSCPWTTKKLDLFFSQDYWKVLGSHLLGIVCHVYYDFFVDSVFYSVIQIFN